MDKGKTAVTVFDFNELIDHGVESMRRSRFKATREAIAKLGGQVVEGTGREVPIDVLDDLGRFRRVATGWGELA